MTRILHCSDIHLDTSFSRLGLPAHIGNRLRAELRSTLGSICSEARKLQVDVLTIAGDLFEQANAVPELARFLAQQFERMDATQVLIAPGERDPYSAHSLYALTRWPSNVHIFTLPAFEPFAVSNNLVVWGAACPTAAPDAWQRQIHLQPHSVNLLLAHASNVPNSRASVFVVTESTLETTGIDLALLGSSHQVQIPQSGNRIVFPGSPQPLEWNDTTAKRGVVLVSITGGAMEFEQIQLPGWRYGKCAVSLQGCRSADEVATKVEQAHGNLRNEGIQTVIAQVALTGEPEGDFTLEEVRAALSSEADVVLSRPFAMPYNLDQLAQEPTVRGSLVMRAREQLAGLTDDAARAELLAALNYALMALEGRQVHPDAIG